MTVRIRLKRQKRRSSFLKSGCSCGDFEAVLQKRTKKKSPENRLVTGLFGGELGIRTLEAFRLTAFRVLHLRPLGQLSVYVIPFSFEKLFARTDGKNNKIFNFRTEQKLSIYGDFEGSILPNSQKISSQPRYDHFDTAANAALQINLLTAQLLYQKGRWQSMLTRGFATIVCQAYARGSTYSKIHR